MSLRKRGSSWCRTGSADRLLRPIGRHPPPSSSSAPALIGNLSGSSCACLTSGWPIGRYWSRPPGPNRRYSPNTNRCFKPRPVTKPTLPISALLRPILATWHVCRTIHFCTLGHQPNSQRFIQFACACPSNRLSHRVHRHQLLLCSSLRAAPT